MNSDTIIQGDDILVLFGHIHDLKSLLKTTPKPKLRQPVAHAFMAFQSDILISFRYLLQPETNTSRLRSSCHHWSPHTATRISLLFMFLLRIRKDISAVSLEVIRTSLPLCSKKKKILRHEEILPNAVNRLTVGNSKRLYSLRLQYTSILYMSSSML